METIYEVLELWIYPPKFGRGPQKLITTELEAVKEMVERILTKSGPRRSAKISIWRDNKEVDVVYYHRMSDFNASFFYEEEPTEETNG